MYEGTTVVHDVVRDNAFGVRRTRVFSIDFFAVLRHSSFPRASETLPLVGKTQLTLPRVLLSLPLSLTLFLALSFSFSRVLNVFKRHALFSL